MATGMSTEMLTVIAIVAAIAGAAVKETLAWVVKLSKGERSVSLSAPLPLPSLNGKYVREDLCKERIKLTETKFEEAKEQRRAIANDMTDVKNDVRDIRSCIMGR